MSNHLSIAATTAALAQRVQALAAAAVPGSVVSTGKPDDDPMSLGVSIFLYQASPNTTLRNRDLPTRGPGGLLQRPSLPLDLYYLLTFYGDEGQLEAQRLLGAVAQGLHAEPRLGPEMIAQASRDSARPYLALSDLHEEGEPLLLSPLTLSLEELSKLWSVLFRTPYKLSAAYIASAVMIDAELTIEVAPTAQSVHLAVAPGVEPRAASSDGASASASSSTAESTSAESTSTESTSAESTSAESTSAESASAESPPPPPLPSERAPAVLDGLVLWLAADVGLTLDSDGAVAAWADARGQGPTATQSAAAKRPLPAEDSYSLRFDGQDDWLVLDQALEIGTLIVVARHATPSFDKEEGLLSGGDSYHSSRTYFRGEAGTSMWDDSTALGGRSIDGAPWTEGDAIGTLDAWHVYAGRDESPAERDEIVIGRERTYQERVWTGEIGAVLIYDRALSDAELAQVVAGLLGPWQEGAP